MLVHLKEFTDTDATIVIECECGNTHMLDEAGDFRSERVFVYRHGVPTKNLRCCPPASLTRENVFPGKPECRERYRIIVHREQELPYMEIEHISPRPEERVIEVMTITFAKPST